MGTKNLGMKNPVMKKVANSTYNNYIFVRNRAERAMEKTLHTFIQYQKEA